MNKRNAIANVKKKEDLSYEKDPRFIEYMNILVGFSNDRSRIIDGRKATSALKKELGIL